MNRFLVFAVAAWLTFAPSAVFATPIGFVQTNLTSDIPGLADNTDPLLKNPWGMSFSATSPFWISDQVSNVSTLYNAAGAPQALVVATPPGGPTGQVFAGGSGLTMKAGGAATFVFATLAGTIDAWAASLGTTAAVQVTTPGAVYTGLALGTSAVGTTLYAADTLNGRIDAFNSAFSPTTLAGSFTDPNVPAGFTPYNIQNIGGKLYVEYAKRNAPGGFVGVFDTNGNLLQHIADPHLNSPWGIALAPAGFGDLANDLLIGNFGDGLVNAFNPTTGVFIGSLLDAAGNPIINSGLWALGFRSAASGFDPNALYFTAGINDEADGLFGKIQPAATVPEPASLLLLSTGLIAGARHWRTRRRLERVSGAR